MFSKPQSSGSNQGHNGFNTQNMTNHRARVPFRPRNQDFRNGSRANHNHDGNLDHWCETCDRGFPTALLLNNHKQQHQKCNIDGCQFVAHPKIITLHIQMQHSSGLFKKISKLKNPEEIEKWREERRKKYPTKVNIDKKAAELKEKIERGEKMGLKRKEWGKNNDFAGKGQKRSFEQSQQETKPRKPRRNTVKKPKVLPTLEENRSLLPFPGILSIIINSENEDDDDDVKDVNDDFDIEDDIDNTNVVKPEISDKSVVCGALSTLMCDYGSSDEEPEESDTNSIKQEYAKDKFPKNKSLQVPSHIIEEKSKNLKTIAPNVVSICNEVSKQNNIAKSDNRIEDSDSGPEEVNIVRNNSESVSKCHSSLAKTENEGNGRGPREIKVDNNLEIDNSGTSQEKKRKANFVRKKTVYNKPKPRVPSTLIYKLLSKEMKQERNKVLQCVRYILKNNYFEQPK